MKSLLSLFFLLLFYTGQVPAAPALPGPLVEAAWLLENHEDVLVLDVRKDVKSYYDGHIPGAVPVDVKKIRIDREVDGKTLINMRPDAESFQAFMRAHGVNNDSAVVITHRGLTPGQVSGAARLYWQMKYFGFDSVALLDGGNRAWVEELEDLVTSETRLQPGDYVVGDENTELLAMMTDVRHALSDEHVTLVDTRDLRYHVGLAKKDYVFANGHIPGSRHLPYKFLNPASGTMRYFGRDYYLGLLDSLGIDIDDSIIFYCNSAYEASSDWFVIHELLGKKDVRIYDGSLHQWTQYADNPMTTRVGG